MSACAEIRSWFRRTGGGRLILPNGWFGRPYDNIHRLTSLDEWLGALLVELDGQLVLVLPVASTLRSSDHELSIISPTTFVFWWTEYGTPTQHHDVFQSGEIRFVSSAVLE